MAGSGNASLGPCPEARPTVPRLSTKAERELAWLPIHWEGAGMAVDPSVDPC